ncbi:MAG: hypothetical protein JWM10_3303 [Myxococcaceae bacterium]|nr:hypothetical protein [Myxococcaceae bacterium]
MKGSEFDEELFFRAVGSGGARALLIGRRALIALGLPLLTRDYDFWVHIDDIARFNEAAAPFELLPNRTPEAARSFGRYVLEGDERVDVLVARHVPTIDGVQVTFDALWNDREAIEVAPGVHVARPSIEGLILTKRFAARPKDAEDLRQLEVLRARGVR